MRLKLLIGVAAMVVALVCASVALGNYQLRFGPAKRVISQETARICSATAGCKSWSVKPCVRRSLHRIDCRTNYYFPEGGYCTSVFTATLPPWATEIILHHKRVRC